MSIHSVLEAFLKRYANHLAIVLTAIAVGVASTIIMPLFRKPLDVRGKVRNSSSLKSDSQDGIELKLNGISIVISREDLQDWGKLWLYSS